MAGKMRRPAPPRHRRELGRKQESDELNMKAFIGQIVSFRNIWLREL